MTFSCLVVPRDLMDLIRLGKAHSGWLSGVHSRDDQLFLAMKLKHKTTYRWSQQHFIVRHLVFGKIDDDLIPWFKVKAGFQRALVSDSISSAAQLQEWVSGVVQSAAIAGIKMALFVEPDGRSSCAFVFNVEDGVFGVFSMTLLVVEPNIDSATSQDGLVPLAELRTKSVLVVGLGSGGGNVALQLAAAGVGKLTLFDPDRLEPGNLFRHVSGIESVGRYKVDAVQHVILNHGLNSQVTPIRKDILVDTTSFYQALVDTDLVVCASDTTQSRALVNFAAVSTGKPMVSVCTFDGATVGEIVVYQPGLPCLECVRIALRDAGALDSQSYEEPTPNALPYRSESTDRAHSRGTSVDVALVASLATKVSLLTLVHERNLSQFLPTSYLVWGGAKNGERAAPFTFDQSMALKYVPIARQRTCSICGDHLHELERIHDKHLTM